MSELPPGWASAKLAELIAPDGIFSDGDWVESKDQDPTGAIRLLQLADVGDGVFVDKSNRFVNDDKFEQLRCTEVLEDDVLIARMPDPLGRACLAPKLSQRCITVVDVAIVRPGPTSVRPRWLVHFLNSPPVRQVIEVQSSGTTRRRISRGNLAQLELPVPPLPEQTRIAGKLDALLARVDACRERLDRVPGILKRFRQSVLAAATGGELTRDWRAQQGVADEWPVVNLESAASGFSYGSSAKSSKVGKVPVLRMGNIQDGLLDWGDLVFTSDAAEISKYRLSNGDVLFNRTNSPELVGKTAVYRGGRDAIYAGYLIRVRCGERLLPDYLNYCLGSPAGREYCWRVKSDGVSQSNINARKLAAFTFGLPSVEEQKEIIRRVEELLALNLTLGAKSGDARVLVDRISQSALAKAFHGELVPQDPNDEPASVLLAKLKTAQAKASTEPPRRRPKTPRKQPTMSNTDKNSIKAVILKLKTDRFSFDELKAQISGDYDSMRAALFELLEEPSPVVRQVFDEKAKAIQFERVKP